MFSTWYGIWRFKDLKRRTFSDKVLRDKAFNIAKNPKWWCQRGLASMIYKFFDKKAQGSACPLSSASFISNKNEIKQNIELADELHKLIIRNFEVY